MRQTHGCLLNFMAIAWHVSQSSPLSKRSVCTSHQVEQVDVSPIITDASFNVNRIFLAIRSLSFLSYFRRSAKTELLLVQQSWQPRPLPRSPSWMKRTLCMLLTTHGVTGGTFHRLITELFDVVSKSTVKFVLLVIPCSTFDSVSL